MASPYRPTVAQATTGAVVRGSQVPASIPGPMPLTHYAMHTSNPHTATGATVPAAPTHSYKQPGNFFHQHVEQRSPANGIPHPNMKPAGKV